MNKHQYDVDYRRNHDGITNWSWVLWIDDYAHDDFDTEEEAWAAADKHQAELAAEDEAARQEASWQTQDRERNQ